MKKFNYGKTFLLGFGFFGVSVIWSVYNAYIPVFLQNRFLLSAGFIGIFMTLDNIASLFIQPLVGTWSDNLRTRLGRRLPFILIGAPIAAIAFIFLPISKTLPLFFLAVFLLILSMAIWRTPVIALMPDITPSEHRSVANGIINLMGGLGTTIAFLGGADLYDINPSYPFLLAAILVVLSAALVLIFIREPKDYPPTSEVKIDLIKAIKDILRSDEKSPLFMLLAILFWFIAYAGIEALFTLYCVNYLKMTASDGSRLLAQLSLLFLIFAVPAGYIGRSFGRRKTILTGIFLMACGVFSLFFLPKNLLIHLIAKIPVLGQVPVMGLILMLTGIAWALININSLPMVVDMTDELQNGTYTGLYYLFSTLASIIGPIMYGWIIQLSGSRYNLVMLVSPIFLVAAFICMLYVKRGESKKQAEN